MPPILRLNARNHNDGSIANSFYTPITKLLCRGHKLTSMDMVSDSTLLSMAAFLTWVEDCGTVPDGLYQNLIINAVSLSRLRVLNLSIPRWEARVTLSYGQLRVLVAPRPSIGSTFRRLATSLERNSSVTAVVLSHEFIVQLSNNERGMLVSCLRNIRGLQKLTIQSSSQNVLSSCRHLLKTITPLGGFCPARLRILHLSDFSIGSRAYGKRIGHAVRQLTRIESVTLDNVHIEDACARDGLFDPVVLALVEATNKAYLACSGNRIVRTCTLRCLERRYAGPSTLSVDAIAALFTSHGDARLVLGVDFRGLNLHAAHCEAMSVALLVGNNDVFIGKLRLTRNGTIGEDGQRFLRAIQNQNTHTCIRTDNKLVTAEFRLLAAMNKIFNRSGFVHEGGGFKSRCAWSRFLLALCSTTTGSTHAKSIGVGSCNRLSYIYYTLRENPSYWV